LEFQGVLYRQMPAAERKYLLGRFGNYGDVLVEHVMARPYVLTDWDHLSDAKQECLFRQVIENPTEEADLANLIRGAKLRLANPKAADFSCTLCREFIIDHEVWDFRYRLGTSERLVRPKDGELMCDTESGCPRGHWKRCNAFSEKNTQAWNHFFEWRLAGMPIPDCPIQRRNWAFLTWVIEHGASRKLRPTIRSTT